MAIILKVNSMFRLIILNFILLFSTCKPFTSRYYLKRDNVISSHLKVALKSIDSLYFIYGVPDSAKQKDNMIQHLFYSNKEIIDTSALFDKVIFIYSTVNERFIQIRAYYKADSFANIDRFLRNKSRRKIITNKDNEKYYIYSNGKTRIRNIKAESNFATLIIDW